MNGPLAQRAGPLFGALVLVATTLIATMPSVPRATAADPTPAPSASASSSPVPSIDPTPAPSPDPEPSQSPDPTPTPSPDQSQAPAPSPAASAAASPQPSANPDPSASPSPPLNPPGGLHLSHAWIDQVDSKTGSALPGVIDEVATGFERYRDYQVRFQLLNDSDAPIEVMPVLEVGSGALPTGFSTVQPFAGDRSEPFYASATDGPVADPRWEAIAVADLRLHDSADPEASPARGSASYGLSTGRAFLLEPHTYTEVAFAIRATSHAAWRATYAFRLAPSSGPWASAPATATVTLRSKPAIELSPGQRRGVTVDDPIPLYELQPPDPFATAAAAPAALAARPAALLGPLGPGGFTSPHMDFGLTGDSCAACHAAHTAQGTLLSREPSPVANQCFVCHDGSGADTDVKAQFTDPTVPANDAATSSWYSHPATAASNHTTDRENELGGRLERHATCADCHQPHLADDTATTQTTAGWTTSGPIMGASGVSVTNGAAGTIPAFTWNATSSFEYELCFKCHSGFTQLPANDPAHPSRWSLDKSVELNPANASYHPVEAAGKNATAAMTNSLVGTSPYKLWTFQTDSTIRCVNCHGDSRLATPASPPDAAAQSAPHAVANRGILMAPYRDRVLKPQGQRYSATDFALCYQCHAESPMADYSGDPNPASNFRYHGAHLNLAFLYGAGGTDIDQDGAGQGNLVCAECHFRIHGTTFAVDGQPDTSRLVNFAPNAQPYLGTLSWTKTATGGSCTLVCHGVTHRDWSY